MENFGVIVKEKRKELNLSQQEVASRCDLTYQTVINVEMGRQVTMTTLKKICEVLGLSIELINN